MERLDASEIYPRRLNAKEVLITPKNGEFVFPVADGSAKLSGRDYELQEPTQRREPTVRTENLSGESHGDREGFQPEETKDDEGINKDFWAHAEARKEFHLSSSCWTEKFNLRSQGDGVPKACVKQAAADSWGPNLRVCKHLFSGVAHAGKERRINVLPWYRLVGVAKTSCKSWRRKNWAARKSKWSPRGTGMTVLTYPCPTASRVSVAVRECARVTGKAGENGQYSGNRAAVLTLDKTVGSRVWRHTQGSSKRPALVWGGDQGNLAPGSLSTGSPAGRTPLHGDGSMCNQAHVRINGPSAAVRDRGHWKGVCGKWMGPSEELRLRSKDSTGGKVVAPVCVSKPSHRAGEEPEDHKRPRQESFLISQDSHYWKKLLREEVYDARGRLEKSQNIGGKIKFNCIDIAVKGRNSVLHYNFAQEFVPMKRSQESSSLNFLWRWKQAHVVSSRGTAYLWDKILQVNVKKSGEYDRLSSENLGRKK